MDHRLSLVPPDRAMPAEVTNQIKALMPDMNKKEREAHTAKAREERIEEELRDIYEDESGTMPDLSTLEAPTRSWRKTGLVAAGIFLAISAGIALWLAADGFRFRESDYVNISVIARPIETEEEVSQPLLPGLQSRIAVRYENIGNGPISSLSLRVNLPDTFAADRFVPEPTTSGNTWELGSLGENSDGLIELYGTLLGDVPSVQKIQIVATYRPANFSSEFDTIVLFELPLNESPLALQVAAPDKTSPGEEVEMSFELLNPSRGAVQNVELAAIVPEGFLVLQSEPPLGEGFLWKIPRMEAHSKAVFTLSGSMSANTRGLHDVGGRVFIAREAKRYRQVEQLRSIDVFGGALATSVIVNGSARDQQVDPGTLLRISIPVENTSEIGMNNVELELEMKSVERFPIDWDADGLNLGGGSRTETRILWNKGDIEAFEQLGPRESTTVDLTLPLYASLPEEASDDLTLTATVGASPATNINSRISLSTTPITLRLNSLVSLFSSAIYHDTSGNAIGSGPLPPRVGEKTTYAIVWSVESDTHELQNFVLEAELPAHSQFEEGIEASTGSLSYRVDGRRVRWEVDRLQENASARFNVSVTPEESDVGSFLKLMNSVSLSAKDAETGSFLRREGNPLTTQLRDDAFATDDGIVVE